MQRLINQLKAYFTQQVDTTNRQKSHTSFGALNQYQKFIRMSRIPRWSILWSDETCIERILGGYVPMLFDFGDSFVVTGKLYESKLYVPLCEPLILLLNIMRANSQALTNSEGSSIRFAISIYVEHCLISEFAACFFELCQKYCWHTRPLHAATVSF